MCVYESISLGLLYYKIFINSYLLQKSSFCVFTLTLLLILRKRLTLTLRQRLGLYSGAHYMSQYSTFCALSAL